MRFPVLTILTISIAFWVSCKKNDDLIPSYIHIPSINLSTVYEFDGSSSNKITDAWVYIDDNLLGAFELPATIPILSSGSHKIMIKAGIKINGISMSRTYYPFYQPWEGQVDLKKEEVDTIVPTVYYYPGKVNWNEDFEEAGVTIQKYGPSDTLIVKTSEAGKVFEGSASGIVTLSSGKPLLMNVSSDIFNLPQNTTGIFLEMNYKCNVEFVVGLCAILGSETSPIQTLILNPSGDWNKIYVNLTYTANSVANTSDFRVYFYAALPEGSENGEILLDNLKLVYNKP